MLKSIIIEGIDRTGKDTLIKGIKNKLGYFQEIHYQKPESLECLIEKSDKQFMEELQLRSSTVMDDRKARENGIAALSNIERVDQLKKRQKEIDEKGFMLYQIESFENMFLMLNSEARFILNRAHLGEFVYAKRYRNYVGDYVFDLEKKYAKIGKWNGDSDTFVDEGDSDTFVDEDNLNFDETTLLVLLTTSSFDFIKDDGESFDFSKKEEEQQDFIEAFNRSIIQNKLLIDVHDGKGGFLPKDETLKKVLNAF